MLSRRDKLLIRPWQQKRFENHRRKVCSALPAIDNKPPVSYNHVGWKLKKQQLEKERIKRIEKENLILLQKLNHIMKTCRVDHFWTNPPPDFLSREPIYECAQLEIIEEDTLQLPPTVLTQKSRCLACCPEYQPPKPTIPEERVPWAPVKPPTGKQRSQSVPLPKLSSLEKQSKINSAENLSQNKISKVNSRKEKKSKSAGKRIDNRDSYKDFHQKLVLSRGNFKLVVNFPTDTTVSLKDAFTEKVLLGKPCTCKAIIN